MLKPAMPISHIYYGVGRDVAIRKIWEGYLQHRTPKDSFGIYFHIPFCTQKCTYCAFNSCLIDTALDDRYVDQLISDMKQVASVLSGEEVQTVCFGGGSPSLLSPAQLEKILVAIDRSWNVSTNPKYQRAFEGHPHQITSDHIKVLRDSFINRMNLGVQSFQLPVLAAENRALATPDHIAQLYQKLRTAVSVTNIDFLIGLFEQTPEMVLKDVRTALAIGTESVFAYELHPTKNHPANKQWIDSVAKRLYTEVYPEFKDTYMYEGTTLETSKDNNIFYRRDALRFEKSHPPTPFQPYTSIAGFLLPGQKDRKVMLSESTQVLSFSLPTGIAYQTYEDIVRVVDVSQAHRHSLPNWGDAYASRGIV